MQTRDSSHLLRLSLFCNGVFSTLSGIYFIVAWEPLSSLIGLKIPAILFGIGVLLLLFAGGLIVNAKRSELNQTEAWIAVFLDVAWVVGSGVVILAGVLNYTGNWAVAIVADVVLVFAILQFLGLRRMRRGEATV